MFGNLLEGLFFGISVRRKLKSERISSLIKLSSCAGRRIKEWRLAQRFCGSCLEKEKEKKRRKEGKGQGEGKGKGKRKEKGRGKGRKEGRKEKGRTFFSSSFFFLSLIFFGRILFRILVILNHFRELFQFLIREQNQRGRGTWKSVLSESG